MKSDKAPANLEECIAWLAEVDAKSREIRAGRLQEILMTMPIPSVGFHFFNAGDLSKACFDEVRRCLLDGSNIAVTLRCLSYLERELAGVLYAAGWTPARAARLRTLLDEARE